MASIQLIKRDTGDSVYVVRIITTSTLADVATTNYLHDQKAAIYAVNNGPFFWQPSDFVLVYAIDGWEQFTISPDFNSLIPFVSTGNVTLPVQDNHVPLFDGTTGRIKNSSMHYDNGALQIPGGDVIAGIAGVQGFFQSHPPTDLKGVMNFMASDQQGDFESTLTNDNFGQATLVMIADPGTANGVIPTITSSGSISGKTVYPMNVRFTRTFNISFSDLNAGGITIIASTGSQQFQFKGMSYSTLSNFDNTGTKEVVITCGSQKFATIPKVSLTGANVAFWADSAGVLNGPSSPTTIGTHSTAGTNIVVTYGAGTTNYSTGQFELTIDVIQVA